MSRSSTKKVVNQYVEVNGSQHKITIFFEKRRNCRASLVKDGMNIRIPQFLTQFEQQKRIQKLKEWGIKRLSLRGPQLSKSYVDQSTLQVGGRSYTLHILSEERKSGASWVKGNHLIVKLPAHLQPHARDELCSKLVRRAIGQDHLPYIQEKVALLNDRHFRENYQQVRLRYNHSNWGSCSSNGNITISTRLLVAPEDVIDYVCLHELAHLREPNHSLRFWRLVQQAMPSFREKDKWLKQNGYRCYF